MSENVVGLSKNQIPVAHSVLELAILYCRLGVGKDGLTGCQIRRDGLIR
jgi:hypothetical protein